LKQCLYERIVESVVKIQQGTDFAYIYQKCQDWFVILAERQIFRNRKQVHHLELE